VANTKAFWLCGFDDAQLWRLLDTGITCGTDAENRAKS
jgi:hypothetical protein